jgi:hypothetical protein
VTRPPAPRPRGRPRLIPGSSTKHIRVAVEVLDVIDGRRKTEAEPPGAVLSRDYLDPDGPIQRDERRRKR